MAREPKVLTKDELEALPDVQIFGRDRVMPIPAGMLALLGSELVKLEGMGINPNRVRIEDFDSAMIVSPLSPVPGHTAPDFVHMAFRHYRTGRAQGGFGVAVPTHFPTVVSLTHLAVPADE